MFDRFLLFLWVIAIFSACSVKNDTPPHPGSNLKYARNFSFRKISDSVYEVEVFLPGGNKKYFLTNSSTPKPGYIHVPVNKTVCLSTTHLGYLEVLGEEEKIAGISGKNYVYNEKIRDMIRQNKIKDVGFSQSLDIEEIINIKPEVVFAYDFNNELAEKLETLKKLGINVVFVDEYEETDPLGRAEWVKFFGLFSNKLDTAEKIFNEIEQNYLNLKNSVSNVADSPLVLLNLPFNGVWYFPGKKSFFYRLLIDAGLKLPFNRNVRVFNLSFEEILKNKDRYDFFLIQDRVNSIEEIIDLEPRLKDFPVIENKKVYNNNRRTNKTGANDFYESGAVRVDLILSDLIKIAHFQQDSGLFYYRKVE